MSTSLRHPSRLETYSFDGLFYPRELTELDGKLYFTKEDGTSIILNPDATTSTKGLVLFSTTTGKAAGTASAGTEDAAARADHVHPLQTTVSGNAGSATKLATARTIDGVSFTGEANVTRYATCSTASATVAKTASITAGTFSLATGARVTVKFTYANTAASPTLNVNSTGAKSIYWHGAVLSSDQYWAAGAVVDFVYNGTQWDLVGIANNTTISGNAGSATKLATARTIGLSGVTATAQSFDGTANITIPITAVPASIVTGLSGVATSGAYDDLSGTPDIPVAATAAPLVAGTAAVGTSAAYAREDHVHPAQTSVTGNAGTATKLATARTIDGISFAGDVNVTRYATCSTAAATVAKTASVTAGTFTLSTGSRVTVKFSYANTAASPTLNVNSTGVKSIYWHGAALASGQYWEAGAVLDFVYNGTQWDLIGIAKDNNSTYSAGTATPLVAGTASVGTSTAYAREDHVHPVQTTVSGNAGSATKLATTRYIDGVSFTGEANVTRYATCSTASATVAKTASITAGTFSLITGARVTVKFSYANTAASPTLNVGSTGAKSIYWHGAALAASQYWEAGAVIDFVYNGTQWDLVGIAKDNNTDTTYTAGTATPLVAGTAAVGTSTAYAREDHVHPAQTTVSGNAGTATTLATARTIDGISFNGSANIYHYTTCSTAAATAAKVASMSGFILATGASITVKFTYSNTASSPTLNVNSTGDKSIYYHGAAVATDKIVADGVYTFIYDGTRYVMVDGVNNNITYPVSVGTTWTDTDGDAPYTQTITVSGITTNDNPIVGVVLSSATTIDEVSAQLTEYAKIYRITTADDSITVYASEATESEISIQLKCVR